jgi:hypothetical protein
MIMMTREHVRPGQMGQGTLLLDLCRRLADITCAPARKTFGRGAHPRMDLGIGRMHSSGTGPAEPDPDASCVAEAVAGCA